MASLRFTDLPREIRDKIFAICLCTFPLPDSIIRGTMLSKKDLTPGILRASKQIYAESTEFMIKTNRFVHVCFTSGVHFADLCKRHSVPTLAFDMSDPTTQKKGKGRSGGKKIEPVTQRFHGYALRVTIGNSNRKWKKYVSSSELLKRCSVIVLFRDVEFLCRVIMKGDERLDRYKRDASLDINVAPVLVHPPFQTAAPTDGAVSPELADAAKEQFSRDKYDNPDALVETWTAAKEKVKSEIKEAHEGPSWPLLLEKGGPSFVAKVAELFYIANLNIAHIGLQWMEGDMDIFPGVQSSIESLKQSTEKKYWGIYHTWKSSRAQQVQEWFKYSMFLRLWDMTQLVPFAAAAIDMAARASPNDAAIAAEKRKVAAWKAGAGSVEESVFNAMINGLDVDD
ncbi:hypothetical protein BU23DRAFT_567947 [Bimuria novae-zelandiae CBS 107.79]|uniref:F-box domain-containing protein n=1 Tax=Bimuria novae-zelandiae CBS 107.79 TaxID=1447943 RepID=A0A6A5VFN6_9PLEO|nr:hypothetical protein BU23DRAFT_567947 [Bimuria novae-zelandiae CBS 107.79]